MGRNLFHSGARQAMAAGPLHRALAIAGPIVLALAASAEPMAHSQSAGVESKAVSVDELKRAYLVCSGAALSSQLSSAAVMQCSTLYEELKRRAFGGDFEKLLAWSRANPSVPNTAQ